jgi:hypothetical protein
MSNAFTTPEPTKEEGSSLKICLDEDFAAESDKDSDSEIPKTKNHPPFHERYHEVTQNRLA